jgi:DNA-binding YbaB/EbfC family protein
VIAGTDATADRLDVRATWLVVGATRGVVRVVVLGTGVVTGAVEGVDDVTTVSRAVRPGRCEAVQPAAASNATVTATVIPAERTPCIRAPSHIAPNGRRRTGGLGWTFGEQGGRGVNSRGGGFGGQPDIQQLMKQAQKMQEQLQAAQAQLAAAEVTGSAGGGLVTATMQGSGELTSLTIDAAVVDPGDIETLQDLVVAAVRDAHRAVAELANETMGPLAGGADLGSLGIPGL